MRAAQFVVAILGVLTTMAVYASVALASPRPVCIPPMCP